MTEPLSSKRKALASSKSSRRSARSVSSVDSAFSLTVHTVEYPSGHWYEGTIHKRSGEPHGSGRFVWKDGSTYEGEFSNGLCSGSGSRKWMNGRIYTGAWKNDLPDGYGVEVRADGTQIEGQFRAGLAHGECALTSADGNFTYKGDFERGEPHGYGLAMQGSWEKFKHYVERLDAGDEGAASIVAGKPGWCFVGEFVRGKRCGRGKCRWWGLMPGDQVGSVEFYDGEWRDDAPHGHGYQRWRSRIVYVGEFQDGSIDGYGKKQFPDGSIYVGNFVEGEMHGDGAYEWSETGDQYRGHWEHNAPGGLGERRFKDGTRLIGTHCETGVTGEGYKIWPSGHWYSGDLVRSKLHGQGTFHWADGREYAGAFRGEEMHGHGVLTWSNDADDRIVCCTGVWKNNRMVSPMRVLVYAGSSGASAISVDRPLFEYYGPISPHPESGRECLHTKEAIIPPSRRRHAQPDEVTHPNNLQRSSITPPAVETETSAPTTSQHSKFWWRSTDGKPTFCGEYDGRISYSSLQSPSASIRIYSDPKVADGSEKKASKRGGQIANDIPLDFVANRRAEAGKLVSEYTGPVDNGLPHGSLGLWVVFGSEERRRISTAVAEKAVGKSVAIEGVVGSDRRDERARVPAFVYRGDWENGRPSGSGVMAWTLPHTDVSSTTLPAAAKSTTGKDSSTTAAGKGHSNPPKGATKPPQTSDSSTAPTPAPTPPQPASLSLPPPGMSALRYSGRFADGQLGPVGKLEWISLPKSEDVSLFDVVSGAGEVCGHYSGEFSGGVPHGCGVFVEDPLEPPLSGMWVNGILDRVLISSADGRHVGQFPATKSSAKDLHVKLIEEEHERKQRERLRRRRERMLRNKASGEREREREKDGDSTLWSGSEDEGDDVDSETGEKRPRERLFIKAPPSTAKKKKGATGNISNTKETEDEVIEIDALTAMVKIQEYMAARSLRVLDLFRQLDADGDGALTREEFGRALDTLGIATLSHEECCALVDQLDSDGSGDVSYKELEYEFGRLRNVDRELLTRQREQLQRGGKGIEALLSGGPFSIMYENGDRYHGYLRRGRKHGDGVYIYAGSTLTYSGFWKDDVLDDVRHPMPEAELTADIREAHRAHRQQARAWRLRRRRAGVDELSDGEWSGGEDDEDL